LLDRVIRTRDVIFKRKFSFKDDAANKVTAGEVSEQELETLDLAQPHFTATANDLYTTEQMDRHLEEIDISIASDTLWPNPEPHTRKDHSAMDSTRGTISPHLSPTPERSPTPKQSPTPERSPSPDNSTIAVIRRPIPSAQAQSDRHAQEIPGYFLDRRRNNAPQALNPDIGEHNVISRSRRSRAPPAEKKRDGVSSNFLTYYGTFASALRLALHQKITTLVPKTRIHRD
jgi:hypothetical protein